MYCLQSKPFFSIRCLFDSFPSSKKKKQPHSFSCLGLWSGEVCCLPLSCQFSVLIAFE